MVTVNSITDSLTPVGVSQLGTVVFDNVVFPAGAYVDLNGDTQTYNEVVLDAVQVSVSRAKEIIKSKVSGRDGSIKEYVSADDYVISLVATIGGKVIDAAQLASIAASAVGGLVGFSANLEDTELIKAIAELDKVPDRVEIRSKFLQNNFDITHVVIENMDMEKSGSDTYRIRFTLLSDFDTDLKDFG